MNDFLNIWPHDSPVYANNLQVIKDTCSRLGILENIEGPSQSLTILRITLDIMLMQALLPDDKLNQIRNEVAAWLSCKKEAKRLILFVDLLQHATKAVRQGEHLAPGCIKQQLNLKVVPHCKTYCRLLVRLEMVALICHPCTGIVSVFSIPDYFIASDASGFWAVFGFQWMQLAWPKDYAQKDIMAKAVRQQCEFQMWYPGDCGLSQQVFILRALNCVPFMIPEVFLSLLYVASTSQPERFYHFSWPPVMKPILSPSFWKISQCHSWNWCHQSSRIVLPPPFYATSSAINKLYLSPPSFQLIETDKNVCNTLCTFSPD